VRSSTRKPARAVRAGETKAGGALSEIEAMLAPGESATLELKRSTGELREAMSAGRFPAGITPESLTRDHLSVQRNPIIAEVFHRTGLIEKWGRGTNRVAEMCRAARIAPPEFAEVTGAAVVTFRVPVSLGRPRPELGAESRPESRPESLQEKIAAILEEQPRSKSEIGASLGHRSISGELNKQIHTLLELGLIERTVPDKPNSRLQRYRLTDKGRARLAAQPKMGEQ
jgi:ATP-dependent DNA helicase RecG